MKQFITLITIISLSLTTEAHPVIKRTKSCGGWFGYSYVNTELVAHEGSSSGHGWVIECTGRGFAACPKRGRETKINNSDDSNTADIYDHAVAEDLIEDVEDKISTGSSSGSFKVTRQVQGQSFKRIYTIRWSSEEVSCGQNELNEKSTFEVDVEYISN